MLSWRCLLDMQVEMAFEWTRDKIWGGGVTPARNKKRKPKRASMEPWSTVVSRGGEGSGEGAAEEGREELETHVVSQQRGVSVWRTGVAPWTG